MNLKNKRAELSIGIDGRQYWYEYGRRHRKNGPALIAQDQTMMMMIWFQHGRIHRIGGPAIIEDDYLEYWEYGVRNFVLDRK